MSIRNKSLSYNKLSPNGVVRKGTLVQKGDVIVGKTFTKVYKEDTDEKTDSSVSIKNGEEGYIDQIFETTTVDGNRMLKIKIRNVKIPELGDKFSSRYAQKGICGMIYPQEDMPFTAEGITPDIIINPACLISRMTIGQLIECILGKYCVMSGTFGDSTAFSEANDNPVHDISSKLKEYGYEGTGTEIMYNGMTGEELDARIFIGPTYYQRLKHMVSDKQHSRAIGNVTVMVRQPLDGRSREGGLKLGEMEKDALISHGTSVFLKERLYDMSDPFQVKMCQNCGTFLSGSTECKGCRDDEHVVNANIPYACKLLIQELNAMNIKTKITLK